MHELKTSFIAETLKNYTNDICSTCKTIYEQDADVCAGCRVQPLIKLLDRINDGEPVVEDTKLKEIKDDRSIN